MTPDKWDERAKQMVHDAYSGVGVPHNLWPSKVLIARISEALRAARDEGVGECRAAIDKHAKAIAAHYEAAGMKELGKIRIETCMSLDAAIRALARPESEKPPAPAGAARCRTCTGTGWTCGGHPAIRQCPNCKPCRDCGPRTEGT